MLFERKSKEVKFCIPQIKLVKLKVVAKIYNVIEKIGAYSELNDKIFNICNTHYLNH